MFVHYFSQFRVLLGELLEARRIGDNISGGKLLGHLFVTIAKLIEFFGEREDGHG